jgi:HK97 gp10 family phage protein
MAKAAPLLAGTSIKPFGPIPTKTMAKRKGKRLSGAVIEVQGLNAVIEHWYAVAQMTLELAPQVMDFYMDVIVHNARQFVRKDTWATHDSIHRDPIGQISFGNFFSDAGPTTFYSKFLEWGTIHAPAYPFMLPAIDMIEKDYIRAFTDIAKIPDQLAGQVRLTGDVGKHPGTRSVISRLRGRLYSTSKFLGDIAVFGATSSGLRDIRSFAIHTARLLGDVDAAMRGQIGRRFQHRLRGRATGRLSGFGSASLSASKSYTGSISGGHRIYNRAVGRLSAPIVSTRLPGLGG